MSEKHFVDGVFNDSSFLKDPASWADMDYGKYCCLKRKDEHAFILTGDNPGGMNGEVLISLGYIFDGGTGEVVKYDSVDALVADGWRVN